MAKVTTGVEGLDHMLQGGLIGGRPYLVIGGPGSGKTTLAWSFLLEGALREDTGLYITLDEPADEIRINMARLGISDKLVKLSDFTPEISPSGGRIEAEYYLNIDAFLEKMLRLVNEFQPTRMVIDSLTTLKLIEPRPLQYRRTVLAIMRAVVLSNITTLLITEQRREDSEVECALARGVIELQMLEKRGVMTRGMKILKIRGSDFDHTTRPMKITEDGIEVYHFENLYD